MSRTGLMRIRPRVPYSAHRARPFCTEKSPEPFGHPLREVHVSTLFRRDGIFWPPDDLRRVRRAETRSPACHHAVL